MRNPNKIRIRTNHRHEREQRIHKNNMPRMRSNLQNKIPTQNKILKKVKKIKKKLQSLKNQKHHLEMVN